MKLKINDFYISVTFPSVALFSFIVISNSYTGYVLSFLSIIIHEFGHLIAMIVLKRKPEGFAISAFDIRIIHPEKHLFSFTNDVIITLSGPAINLIFFIFFFNTFKNFAYVNLFVGSFNLLPITSLDGGQLLFLFLNRKLTAELSCKIIDSIAIILSFFLFLLGLMILLNSKYNFSLLFLSIYIILSVIFKKDKISIRRKYD